ncbi:MAG TPA: hypothetical protein VH024_17980 [Candidatus Angelobacter sp.]|jgi:hypothetical protein|nr:hypothetical protein [Candidatus Angelobacter sp.]
MADQEKDKQMQIDEMLDSMLANYSSVEPRPGLETRILANLREAEEKEAPHGWWNFKWLWAGMVTAAIIVAAALINGRWRVEPPTHVIVTTNQPAPQPEIQPHAPIAPKQVGKIHRRKPPVPTLPQDATLALSKRPANFPTPVPLSEQERLMFTYLANTPQEIVIAQIPRNDDEKESEEFWADREPSSGTRRSTTNR